MRCTGGFWRIGAGLPQLDPMTLMGGQKWPPGPLCGRAPGGGGRFFDLFFLHPSPPLRLSVYGIGRAKKSGGGGSHGASINPRWGGTPPPVDQIHGFYSEA